MKIQTSTYNHLTKFSYCATVFFFFFPLFQYNLYTVRCTVTIPRSCGNSSGYLHRYKQSCKPFWGFLVTSVKEPACQCRRCKRRRFDAWVGSSPGEGNGSPVRCSRLENSMDRGLWQATVHTVTKSNRTKSI